ncbi:type II toxin-antitoxin system death-on-curing family toxin [Methanoculleus sp. 7T]|jgi:death-on-curing protein|uniref:type II toxin-antitoxin system death-on-curing family toxin n=1 Tax=Methanoculleus sp. 7T TaxID=2937282 RepID=UPI0020BE277C|nr:type II toxin-antitoxin system death-on-curing family toxin [Methanoculleus sp. 7T]MCK8518089.1 type II toxin-antitoxin system death-on-curing family toxin [Methanoculleus sp. 7T]
MLRLAPTCPSPYCDDIRMNRAFIRDIDDNDHPVEIPIGWWCPRCGWLVNDITEEKIIAIHDTLIALHDRPEDRGWEGLKDPGCVETWVSLWNDYWVCQENIYRKAAWFLEVVTNGHGFWQGNKRTAYTATDVLILRANGYIFDADAEEVDRFMVTLADLDDDGNSRYTLDEVEDWIRANAKRIDIFSVPT